MTDTSHANLLGGPAPTLLPAEPELTVSAGLGAGTSASDLAARYPAASLPWAVLAEQSLTGDRVIEAYAYARTGYHRGLDALRRSGWKGHGPVPWEHEANRGFLRALIVLGQAAQRIGEQSEAERCTALLADCDPTIEDTTRNGAGLG